MSKNKIKIKLGLSNFLYFSRFIQWRLRKINNKTLIILMYHRVLPEEKKEYWLQPGMHVSLKNFENQLKFLKSHFNIISFVDIKEMSNSLYISDKDKPKLILTFDDGWYDFYEYVYPLLKLLNIKATVFLPTNLIGTNKWLWSDRLAYIIYQKNRRSLTNNNKKCSKNPIINKLESYNALLEDQIEYSINLLKKLRNDEIEKIILELIERWNIPNKYPAGRSFLNWEEVKEMFRSGLISFGSHTENHSILTKLNSEQLLKELIKSKEKLISKNVVNTDCLVFSYPNGNYNERINNEVRKAGYSFAVTTDKGWNYLPLEPYKLKRISIHNDVTYNLPMLGCRVLNLI
ncbi:MAG: polysaccharide deacetylase family protein [Promethearchaeota archaeon]